MWLLYDAGCKLRLQLGGPCSTSIWFLYVACHLTAWWLGSVFYPKQGFQETQADMARVSMIYPQNFENVTIITFFSSSKLLKPAQIQGEGM